MGHVPQRPPRPLLRPHAQGQEAAHRRGGPLARAHPGHFSRTRHGAGGGLIMFKRTDMDFADELRAHIELETERLIASGMTPADASAAAHKAFGNATRARERFHESRGVFWEQVIQDVRYAARA